MDHEKSVEEWAAEYGARRITFEEFARRVEALVMDLLDAEGIDVIQVESRAKTVASFTEKIRRKGRENTNPFESLTDLVGVRIITYYLDDVKRVGDMLAREFTIDAGNSNDKIEDLASDQFGYRSAHYVARLTTQRAKLVEWRAFDDLVVELQVRTSLQHAWASVSHKLEYKSASEAPAAVQRQLFRLSALFEIADEQFSAIRDQSIATDTAYREEVTRGELDIPLDTSSVEAFWSTSKAGVKFKDALVQLGFDMEHPANTPAHLERDRADLVKILREVGINSLADLDSYLRSKRPGALAQALKSVVSDEDKYGVFRTNVNDLLTQLVIIDTGKIDSVGEEWYRDGFTEVLLAAAKAARERGLDLN